ncbi:hypothetical protein BGZ73_002588 [Actinomortierella ambigua]|nr:hypothetical protein BGZ73_002588 [Actinomortierella ambigua]
MSSISKYRIPVTQLHLGLMTGPTEFTSKFVSSGRQSIRFNDSRKRLELELCQYDGLRTHRYELQVEIKDLEQGCLTVQDDEEHQGRKWVTLQMKIPPIVYRLIPTSDLELAPGSSKFSRMAEIRRATDLRPPRIFPSTNTIQGSIHPSPDNSVPPASRITGPQVLLGKWLVVRLQFNHVNSGRLLAAFLYKASEYNLFIPKQNLKILSLIVASESPQRTSGWASRVKLHFDVMYLLESALSFNYLIDDNITTEFLLLLSQLDHLIASNILESIIFRGKRIWDPLSYLQNELERHHGVPGLPRMVPTNTVLLRKIAVTPTTMYLMPPSVETSNRIIRKYASYQDFFLRVEFTDEGRERLWAREGNVNTALFNRIFSCLVNGIRIGDRLYEFLAFSSSQLRDNAAWFYCSDGGRNPTPDDIRAWMGDFSHIRSIAKYGARMGQCFSSTMPVRELPADTVHLVPDIEYHDAVLSDGCGLISPALAGFIASHLNLDVVPSAFQIRLGGSKGVLAVAPPAAPAAANLDPNDAWVIIRPSMKKFDSNFTMLEIIRTSGFTPAYLNRQAILLMSALGVPDQVFLDLKDKMVHDLGEMEFNEAIAYRVLISQPDEGGACRMMANMVKAGFLREGDLFLRNMVKLCRVHMMEALSKRARIHVPQGAFLYGVVDETGTLNENEIFVQVSSLENPHCHKVVVGNCVLFRNPCFHPGDIRVVQAVDNPRQRALHDVVVFNIKGHRSLPSMCSGGDLDGDEFTVLWDESIVSRVRQHEPMSYKGPESLSKHEISIYDIQRFFVQYVVANNLGNIANSHLALADQLPKGPLDGKCLRLAELHSNAVDFHKTGIPAEMHAELRPSKYPDFMGKLKDRSYVSEKVLGVLYRECGIHEQFTPLQEGITVDSRLVVAGHEQFEAEARKLKALYDREMLCLCNQYGIQSEIEIVSGFVVSMEAKGHRRDYEFRRKVSSTFQGFRKMFRNIFHEGLPRQQPHTSTNEQHPPTGRPPLLSESMKQKASAWYLVSYRDWQPGQLYTFAWCIWDILCSIADASSTVPPPARPIRQNSPMTDVSRSTANLFRATSTLWTCHPSSKAVAVTSCPLPNAASLLVDHDVSPLAPPLSTPAAASSPTGKKPLSYHSPSSLSRRPHLQVMTADLSTATPVPAASSSKPHVQNPTTTTTTPPPASGSPVSPRNRLLINEGGLLQSGTMIAGTRLTTWDQFVEKERQEFSKQGGLASVAISKTATIMADTVLEQDQQQQQQQEQQEQQQQLQQDGRMNLATTRTARLVLHEHPTATLANAVSSPPPSATVTKATVLRSGFGQQKGAGATAEGGEDIYLKDEATARRVQQVERVLERGEQDAKRRLVRLAKDEGLGFDVVYSTDAGNKGNHSTATKTFYNTHGVFVIGADVSSLAIAEALELVEP